MIKIVLKDEYETDYIRSVTYESFDEFDEFLKKSYFTAIPNHSPMQVVMKYYDLYINGIKFVP